MGEMYINKDTNIINKINSVYDNMELNETLQDLDKNKTLSDAYINKLQSKIKN